MSKPRVAVVAAHGNLAASLIESVGLITGLGQSLHAVSNRDLDASGVHRALLAAVQSTGAGVIFTDLPAGSCTMAARRVQRDHPAIDIVAGVNLPLLLDFVLNNAEPPPPLSELGSRAREHLLVWEGTRVD